MTPSPSPVAWPEFLEGYEYRPAHRAGTVGRLRAPAVGIVIHSGDTGAGTAEWCWREEARNWAHFAWSSMLGCFVQTDRLTSHAYHIGPGYNAIAWGIELPGPDEQTDRTWHRSATVELVAALAALGSVRWITGHQFLDRKKRDPGPGVDATWFAGLGLDVRWEWQGRGLLDVRWEWQGRGLLPGR